MSELITKPMEVLYSDGPFGTVKCECGEVFDIDATTGENLHLKTEPSRYLIEQCPKCGAIRKERTDQEIP
jgi:hypothetical protein